MKGSKDKNMEMWKGVKRDADYVRETPITSDIYLQLRAISESIKRNAHYAKGVLVDIGAGNTPYKKHFEKKVNEYIKIDNFEFVNGKPDIFGNALELPIKSNSVDTAFSSQVLEHVPEPQKMVDEIYRILRPQGICILSTHMANPLHGEPHDYFRFTKYGLKEIFKKFSKIENIEENGGALLSVGQFLIWGLSEKLPRVLSLPLIVFLNYAIKKMDRVFYDKRFTTNYVIVARK